jgi:hypothetical protein
VLGRPLLQRLLRPKEAATDLTISMFLGLQLSPIYAINSTRVAISVITGV